MDDQALIHTDLPEAIADRPLVTFALFAYNQEKYVREAVEGAFAQTYEPLEIILSDDCSSDRTFEIMKEMAAGYVGPHRVRVRINTENTGVFNHVLRVAKEAKGELFIVAAGDDISYPERSKITVGEWRRSGACGLFGDADIIDADTNIVEVGFKPAGNAEILQWIEKLGNFNFIHGATAAYDSKIFEKLKLSDAKIYSEDAVLTVLICLIEGGIVRMNCRLVKYRRHSGAISNATQSLRDRASIVAHEIKIADYAGTVPDMCDYILSAAEECGVSLISINKIKPDVVKTKKKYAVRSRWMYSCFLQNAIEFARFPTVDNFYFLLPRIFGIKAFSLFKIIFINLNHIFDKR